MPNPKSAITKMTTVTGRSITACLGPVIRVNALGRRCAAKASGQLVRFPKKRATTKTTIATARSMRRFPKKEKAVALGQGSVIERACSSVRPMGRASNAVSLPGRLKQKFAMHATTIAMAKPTKISCAIASTFAAKGHRPVKKVHGLPVSTNKEKPQQPKFATAKMTTAMERSTKA